MEEQIFKQDAKTITDMLFNIKYFKDEVTRDDMNNVESFIGSMLQSRFESHIKCDELLKSLNER